MTECGVSNSVSKSYVTRIRPKCKLIGKDRIINVIIYLDFFSS